MSRSIWNRVPGYICLLSCPACLPCLPASRLPDCEPHFCDVSPIQWDPTSERWNLSRTQTLISQPCHAMPSHAQDNAPSLLTLRFNSMGRHLELEPSSPSTHFLLPPYLTPHVTSHHLTQQPPHRMLPQRRAGEVPVSALREASPAGIRDSEPAGGAKLAGLIHISTLSLTHCTAPRAAVSLSA